MNKLKKKMGQIMQRIIDAAMGNGLMQEETTASGERYVTPVLFISLSVTYSSVLFLTVNTYTITAAVINTAAATLMSFNRE